MKLKTLNKNQKNLSESINLIPMINLIFLLLIFFLLTGVITKKDSPGIKPPISDSGLEQKTSEKEILIVVNKANKISYNNKEVKLININQIISNKQNKYILEVDKNANIFMLNNIFKELKKKKYN